MEWITGKSWYEQLRTTLTKYVEDDSFSGPTEKAFERINLHLVDELRKEYLEPRLKKDNEFCWSTFKVQMRQFLEENDR